MISEICDEGEDSRVYCQLLLVLLCFNFCAPLRVDVEETPLKELKGGSQIYWIVDVQAVVATKHQADGSGEVGDLVVHNLAVYAEHELPCTIAAGSTYNDARGHRQAFHVDFICQACLLYVVEEVLLFFIEVGENKQHHILDVT